ncbi:MAG: SRPBCC family protein [Gemmatimonadaceae bacterium]
MTDAVAATTVAPVRKSITVEASPARAFQVFTEGIDAWWPRGHHIGKAPMTRTIIESRTMGRCYSEHEDGSESDWGTVLVWEPPRRLVFSWSITGDWQYEPDLARSSEVEVRFTAEPGGKTRVDLEHRHLERHGTGAGGMRAAVDAPDGWGGILRLFADEVEKSA